MLNKEKAVNEIIEEFDFEKVKKVMELLEWTWHDVENTPSIGKLVKTAEKLLNECFDKCLDNKADYFVGSGGFMVRAFYDKEIYRLDLTFEITDWSVYEPL